MWNKEKDIKRGSLSREILGLFGTTAVISVFFYGFLSVMANSIVLSYTERNNIIFDEITEWTVSNWIQSVSVIAAVICFVVLFLFLSGQKMAYLNKIIKGVDALREHRLNYEVSVEGNNELTELAENINYLAKTERELKEKEENLIRSLSHDIRTPLTSILSYSEYMEEAENISPELMKEYIAIVRQKAIQIKGLTEQLLDGEKRELQFFENGKLLMQQLVEEWEESLEEQFICQINFDKCTAFSGNFDVQELRRIFDNLSSNIKKYADPKYEIILSILYIEETLLIEQKNMCKSRDGDTESYGIGLANIREIAEKYNGSMQLETMEDAFEIRIELKCRI